MGRGDSYFKESILKGKFMLRFLRGRIEREIKENGPV